MLDIESLEVSHMDNVFHILPSFDAMEGASLVWEEVGVEVASRRSWFGKNKLDKKKILLRVSGIVSPGDILFVMGPSGAGKSTFLDALTDRIAQGTEGRITLDGQRVNQNLLVREAKYVEQEDHMYSSLTVRETLMFAAKFYCKDPSVRKTRVEETLQVLGLIKQADVKVGGLFVRGLSGGQKRRLAVGTQLLAMPSILFLDEPTSGLDSAACLKLISYLRKLAKDLNLTIVCTIHQPSTEIFMMSDRLLLLAQGRTAYFGPTSKVENYFEELGYPCPSLTSIAEHVIDKINGDFGEKQAVEDILDNWPLTKEYQLMQTEIAALHIYVSSKDSEQEKSARCCGRSYETSFPWQLVTLIHRIALNALRNPLVLWMRVVVYCIFGLYTGTAWLRLERTACNVEDFSGALFFISSFMVLMSISVLPSYIDERHLVMQERANGAYGVIVFNLAHTLLGFVMAFILAFFAGTINYWLTGYNPLFQRYFFFILNLFLALSVAEALMTFVASMIPVLILAFAVAACIYATFMVVMGFFIRLENIGWWWRWMHYISMHSFSFSSFMLNEFTDTFWPPCENTFGTVNAISGEEVLKYYDYNGYNIWVNSAVLFGMVIFYRTATTLWQWKFHDARK
ncbi:hypothetical protein NDN08_004901 [Rhodosorus marinus]|uniref:Probable ATP-dependent transporter ycf16 n=1 Tax=Rhodosorus marinus TaxID=101924 RepID=A0AAV8UEY1_9RHOD|nr:hypothetical protein NDN08_004901 [Rhodosorus marinus]